MKHTKKLYLPVTLLVVISLAYLAVLCPVHAQDEPVEDEAAAAQAAEPVDDEIIEEVVTEEVGLRKGAYWWQDPAPNAIAGFVEFGLDIIVFRLGVISAGTSIDGEGNSVNVPKWDKSINFDILASMPSSLDYRPVVVVERDIFSNVDAADFASWIELEVISKFGQLPVDALEIKLTDDGIPNYASMAVYFDELAVVAGDIEIFAGIPGTKLDTRASMLIESVDGFVVYFTDYDYTGLIPRITDNAWISTTSSILENLGVPFIAVLPIYNQAVYMPADGNEWIRLPSVDVEMISQSSTVTNMGSAGTEFMLTEALAIGNFNLGVNDKVRILSAIEEINIRELTESLPELAPGIREIDVFRFPLVPGFDPASQTAVEKSGWTSGRLLGGGMTAEDAVKQEMDQKHNQTQQIIMIITVGMMMVILMRMFSKGGGAKKEGGDSK